MYFIKQISQSVLWQFVKDDKFQVKTKIIKLLEINLNRWNLKKRKKERKFPMVFLVTLICATALLRTKIQALMK